MEIKLVKTDTLIPAGYNPRKMSKGQMAMLTRGLEEFGVVEPIVVNKRTGRIVGGHQRVEAAKALGLAEVPVTYVELDDSKERALNLALNKISGEWDFPMLKDLIVEIDTGAFDMDLTGFDTDEIAAMFDYDSGGGSGGGGGGGNSLEYLITFTTGKQKDRWLAFLKHLKTINPDMETVAERIDDFIQGVMDGQ